MNILPEKLYSIREAAKLIPGINCGPTLQKIVDLDIKKTEGQIFNAKVLKRNKQKRYFLKGEDLIRIVENKIFQIKQTDEK